MNQSTLDRILRLQQETQEQHRIYICVEKENSHPEHASVGHAFLLGLVLNTNNQSVLSNIDRFHPELKSSIGIDQNGKSKVWTYSLYPENFMINHEKDRKRAKRILLGDHHSTLFDFDTFLGVVVKKDLFEKKMISTPGNMCQVERDLRACDYNLLLANCCKFAAEQFTSISQIQLRPDTTIGLSEFGLEAKLYLPATLFHDINRFKNEKALSGEDAAKAQRLTREYLNSEQFMTDFDMRGENDLLAKFAELENS